VSTVQSTRRAYQFNLRGLLLGSLPLAIFFALLGVVYRGSSSDARGALLEGGAGCLFVFGLGLFVQYQLRHAARHAGGRQYASLQSAKGKKGPVILAASALLLALHMSIGVVSWDRQTRGNLELVVAGVPAVLCFFVVVLFWFDRYDLEVCQQGVILNGLWFRSWRELTGHAWSPTSDSGSTLELRFGSSQHTVPVPPELIGELEELLTQFAAA
jgi:hypothetical protein